MGKRGHILPGWLYPFPWQRLSLSFLHGDFGCEWRVERDVWTAGLHTADAKQLFVIAGSR